MRNIFKMFHKADMLCPTNEPFSESFEVVEPTKKLRLNDGILEQMHIVQNHANGCIPSIARYEWRAVEVVKTKSP